MSSVQITVGENRTARVNVLDQNGIPMPYDFGANVPVWGVDQASNIGLSSGPDAGSQVLTGTAVTAVQAVLSVTVPGVVNGTATAGVDIVDVAQPPQVATSVEIIFE